MRNLKFVAAACGALAFLSFAGAPAQAAKFKMPAAPTIRIPAIRVPTMAAVSVPKRPVNKPPVVPSMASFLSAKIHH